jgi:NADPH2:quinone reductase
MSAIVIQRPGGPDVLQRQQRALPGLGDHEILIEVAAAGVNRADVLQREGQYRMPQMPVALQDIPGLEAAGTVAAIGSNVTKWRIGDRVTALLIGGGYAQYSATDEGLAMPIPAGLSLVEAASLPEVAMTVWTNVFDRCHLQPGETLLVHGGNSGIGSMAIQLGAAIGATVIATAGSPEKCASCIALGASVAINYHDEDFVEVVRQKTNGHGADVILDMIGGDYTDRNITAAAEDGRIVNVSVMGGALVTANLGVVMSKRLTLTGSTLRNRPVAFKADLAAKVVANVWPLIEAGKIKPTIDSTFKLTEAKAAHERLGGRNHIGKIVLEAR